MDTGPWRLFRDQSRVLGVISDDFEHDVSLQVSGDFETPEAREAYCKWLATKLNGDPHEELITKAMKLLDTWLQWSEHKHLSTEDFNQLVWDSQDLVDEVLDARKAQKGV